MKKAKLIALEGIDGSGSTTQSKNLAIYFKNIGKKIFLTAEPTDNSIGLLIRDMLKKHYNRIPLLRKEQFALLYAADRLEHYSIEIEKHLKAGINVICDRYLMSSLAYQGYDLDEKWVENINKYSPPADYTIFIDVHEKIAESRRNKRGGKLEFFDDFEFQKNIRYRYLSLSKRFKIKIVDGNGSKNDVFNRILTCFGDF